MTVYQTNNSMQKKELLIKSLSGQALALIPSFLERISGMPDLEIKSYCNLKAEIFADNSENLIDKLLADEISASEFIKEFAKGGYRSGGNEKSSSGAMVGMLEISGPILYREDEITSFFGLPTIERIEAEFDKMLQDDRIGSIILNIDSPGGTVSGVPELAEKIFQARSKKRIVSIANPLAASAGYWLAASASEFYALPSGSVGSVGVYVMHMDYSGYLEGEGIEVNFIHAGEKKVDANPYEPLSDEARADIQEDVDSIYQDFISAIARFRAVSVQEVEETFGKGRVFKSKDALSRRMINGIMVPKELIRQEMKMASEISQGQTFMKQIKDFVK